MTNSYKKAKILYTSKYDYNLMKSVTTYTCSICNKEYKTELGCQRHIYNARYKNRRQINLYELTNGDKEE